MSVSLSCSLLFCFLFCTEGEFSHLLRFALKAYVKADSPGLAEGWVTQANPHPAGGESRLQVSLDESHLLKFCLKHKYLHLCRKKY